MLLSRVVKISSGKGSNTNNTRHLGILRHEPREGKRLVERVLLCWQKDCQKKLDEHQNYN